jgi:NADH:ubiquinone oxidoreductase subunit C
MTLIPQQNKTIKNPLTSHFKYTHLIYMLILPKIINSFLMKLEGIPTLIISKLKEFTSVGFYQINRKNLYKFIIFFAKHNTTKAQHLIDIIAADIPGYKYRFIIHYELLSVTNTRRWHIYTYTNEVLPLPSITKIFTAAMWVEREVWDMYGIFFTENSDLRRILSDYGFQGHPFRKDFPIMGFIELQYNEIDKLIKYSAVEQTATYRK